MNKSDAWNLLWVTNVNVCYWKNLIELNEKRYRWAQCWAPLIGIIAAVIIAFVDRNWVTTVIPAIVGFVTAALGALAKRSSTRDAKKGHERWSQLSSDGDALWRHANLRGWEDPDITVRAAQLVERQKQYQAHEYHNPKTSVLEKCEALVYSQLPRKYRTEED